MRARAHKISRFFLVSSVHWRRLALNGSFESVSFRLENSCNRVNESFVAICEPRFIEKNQFVHESDTASASRSTWCITWVTICFMKCSEVKVRSYALECSEVKVKVTQNKTTPVKYRYLKNVLKYSNEVVVLRYWPPLFKSLGYNTFLVLHRILFIYYIVLIFYQMVPNCYLYYYTSSCWSKTAYPPFFWGLQKKKM